MNKVKIYALIDPNNNSVRYIGKTELSLEKRLYLHLWDLKRCGNKHKVNWINKLKKENKKPEIVLIEEVDFDDWKFFEQYWIEQFKAWGFNLLNYHEGGSGFTSDQVKKLWEKEEYRNFHTERVQGEKNPFYGHKHTDEVKAILRKKCPKIGIEHGCYGTKMSKDEIEKRRLNQPTIKKITRMSIDEKFIDSWIGLKHMCRELKLDEAAVIRTIKGKQTNHKNFKFKYDIN